MTSLIQCAEGSGNTPCPTVHYMYDGRMAKSRESLNDNCDDGNLYFESLFKTWINMSETKTPG